MEQHHSFLGFVLLETPQWDMAQYLSDLQTRWGISAADRDGQDGTVVFHADGALASISFLPAPVPDHEAEENAAFNFMWRGAAEAAAKHRAQLIISVIGRETSALRAGELFVKLAETALHSSNALGLYANGTVYQPAYYIDSARMMQDGGTPVFSLIWHGLGRDSAGIRAYTIGMENFGKPEIEILHVQDSPLNLLTFLSQITGYVISADVTLHDGETIGMSEEQKCRITLSRGVEFEDRDTLKITYPTA